VINNYKINQFANTSGFIKNIKRTPPLQPQASGAIPNILIAIEIIFILL
jgi:hypothetical protein